MSRDGRTGGSPGARLAQVSFALAVVASVVLLVAPLGTSVESVPAGQSPETTNVSHHSLLDSEGWTVAIVLAIPVVVSGFPVLIGSRRGSRPARIASAVLLSAFVLVGLLSIGIFYLPVAATMVASAATSSPPRAESG